MTPHPETLPERVDVAIIGGGVAGCYLGYRLLEAAHGPGASGDAAVLGRSRVALFEQRARIGGRLLSVPCGGRVVELGGMRFSAHAPLLPDLLEHLDLTQHVVDFDMDRPENRCYLTGTPPAADASGHPAPDALVDAAIAHCFPEFQALHQRYHALVAAGRHELARAVYEAYETRKRGLTLYGQPLYTCSWHQFLRHSLPPDAVAFIEQAGGYETTVSNGSAAGWLDNLFFTGPREVFKCLSTGFALLPQRLHEDFSARGGSTHLEHRLLAFSKAAAGYRLTFANRGRLRKITAATVVLTLPKPALERLGPHNFFLRQIDRNRFNSIRSVDAFKLFLTYPHAWWEPLGFSAGRRTTNLPLRQCYYYRPRQQAGPALLMAAYCNGPDTDSWNTLIDSAQRRFAAPAAQQAAVEAVLKKTAHAHLLALHQMPHAPAPLRAFYTCWNGAQGQPGWHVWDTGALPQDTVAYMQRPVPGERIFLAGEGWSWMPGSVPGALMTAEAVLTQGLGLPSPAWAAHASMPFR